MRETIIINIHRDILRGDAQLACHGVLDMDYHGFMLTRDEMMEIMSVARSVDPTESGIAAEVRDTIRNNFEIDFEL